MFDTVTSIPLPFERDKCVFQMNKFQSILGI